MMNEAAFVVVGKWRTTPMRANGNEEACSTQYLAFKSNVVVTNISQTAFQLVAVIK